MTDLQRTRRLRTIIATLLGMGAAMIWLGYMRISAANVTDVAHEWASSHRFAGAIGVALAPGAALLWKPPRWSRVAAWGLWAIGVSVLAWSGPDDTPAGGLDTWSAGIWPAAAIRLLAVLMFLGYLMLLGTAASQSQVEPPEARVVKD